MTGTVRSLKIVGGRSLTVIVEPLGRDCTLAPKQSA